MPSTVRTLIMLGAALGMCLSIAGSSLAGEPVALSSAKVESTDWPWWRGPNGNGVASADQNPPLKWSEDENVLWHVAVPGRGHGSPTVVGQQVFIATADTEKDQQLVLCFDRDTGKRIWSATIHQGGMEVDGKKKPNMKASMASSTVACDGERLFINFYNQGAIWTSALDRNGEVLWQKKITDYTIHQGYGASPVFYDDAVIVTGDNKAGGVVASLNRVTGEINWKRDRPEKPNYASPIIINLFGKDQLFLTGCDLVTSLDPSTGKELWEIEGATTECVTSTVSDGQSILTSGGYPDNHISAVMADGSGKVLWRNNQRAYVPSLLIQDGYIYATLDAGIATCLKSDTGEEMWKGRLAGTFSSSPVLVGDLIFATNEEGTTFIFRASPEGFELVGKNQLGESVFATPAICDSQIFTRVAKFVDGERQEYLYCLGTKE